MKEMIWEGQKYIVEKKDGDGNFSILDKDGKLAAVVYDETFIDMIKRYEDAWFEVDKLIQIQFLRNHNRRIKSPMEIIERIDRVVKNTLNVTSRKEKYRIKQIADLTTPNESLVKDMPYWSMVKVKHFFKDPFYDDVKKKLGSESYIYSRFDFTKLVEVSEIWSLDGKLIKSEKSDIYLEDWIAFVDEVEEWHINSNKGTEMIIKFDPNQSKYLVYLPLKNEKHILDDEVEVSDYILEKLGGIKVVACDCPMGWCEKCKGMDLIVKIEEK